MNVSSGIREQADRFFALIRHALRFWSTGLVLFLLGCSVALVVAVTRPRAYRSEALILYRERVSASALGRDEIGDSSRRIGMRLRELVLSRSRLERIISELKLYPQLVDERGLAEAVELMRTKVGFKAREGDTYALSFEGEQPEQVQQVTQRLTEALVKENERSTMEQTTGTKDFLDAETQRLDDDLKKRESKLAKFLSEHPAFAAEAARTPAGSMSGAAAAEPKKAISSPRRRSADPRVDALEREAERIQARLSPVPPPSPTLPPEVKEVAEQWNRKKNDATKDLEAALRDLADKRQGFTDEHPDVKRAKAKVDGAQRALDEVQVQSMREMARLQGKTQAMVQPLTQEERERLQGDLVRVQQDLAKLRSAARKSSSDKEAVAPAPADTEAEAIVKLETTWVQLTREVADAQEQRRQVEAKRFTAEIRERLAQTEGSTRMVVIDPPNKPTRPVRGGRTQAAMMGSSVALFLALAVMMLRAVLDDRVYDRFDLERLTLGPLLTVVPRPDAALRRAEKRAERAAVRREAAQEAQRARDSQKNKQVGHV